jgi:2-methylcitrate dehydratase PrpD
MGLSAVLGLDVTRTANAISLAVTPNLPLCVTRRGAVHVEERGIGCHRPSDNLRH